jgi:subtilase family serine protease
VPDALATRWNGLNRVVPDVAAVGDPTTGFLVGETQAFPSGTPRYAEYRIGGTSLSCPVFAAIMALADQAKGIHHGFANPLLYSLAGSAAFRDIVDPPSPMAAVRTDWANFLNPHQGRLFTLRSLNQTGTLDTTPGYDDVTGLGSPNGQAFLDAMS